MSKNKFILRCVGYVVGKIAGLVLALWLVSCEPPENHKPKWHYYQFPSSDIDSVYCVRLVEGDCLYAFDTWYYNFTDPHKTLGCGTFKIIHKKP